MEAQPETPGGPEDRVLVRWIPSVLLDCPPAEPVAALRTPHRVYVRGLPATRDGLLALLRRAPFELTLEVESDKAPLHHAPVEEVHEARLTPDLPMQWSHFYWAADGLLDDLADHPSDAAAGFLQGRLRLALLEEILREDPHAGLEVLDAAWKRPDAAPAPDTDRYGEPLVALHQFVRALSAHLSLHAATPAFVDDVQSLLRVAERRKEFHVPALAAADQKLLCIYAQHRLLGNPHLLAPAGTIAGWHLLLSTHLLAIWWSGLFLKAKLETRSRDALVRSLWLLDQGLWRDAPLVHDVLRHMNASEYASADLAVVLSTALRTAHARA
jgi:hypothetical protein